MDAQASTLGGWLLLELNRRGMSQNDLAAALGVERPAVTKWINGRNRPDIESIVALADFFQVPITVILSKIGIEVDAARVRLPTNQAAGLPPMRYHDLRGVCASLLLADGVDVRTVMHILGHSDPTLTLATYARVNPEQLERAGESMGRTLGG